jgi:hypothetical protein
MEVLTMFGKNRKKKVGICVMVVTASLVLAGIWAVLATPETALAHKTDPKHHGKDKDDGGGEGFAEVTITGPMQSEGPHSFGFGENNNALKLNSWTGVDRGAPVPISYNFVNTVGNCECKEGKNWKDGHPAPCDLKGHLVDTVPGKTLAPFPLRWNVIIVVDMSSLGEFDPENPNKSSTTSKKGGHSIDITTDPDQTPTITGTSERLWIPEGPNKSGLVTVEWVSDTGSDSNPRTRVFKFTPPFKIQVVSNPGGNEERKIMRCDNSDGAITVKVVTAL